MDDPIHPDDWPLVAQAVQEFGEVRQKQPKTQSASFPETDKVQETGPGEKAPAWETLTDAEKTPYLQQADAELRRMYRESKTPLSPQGPPLRLIRSRAQALYQKLRPNSENAEP